MIKWKQLLGEVPSFFHVSVEIRSKFEIEMSISKDFTGPLRSNFPGSELVLWVCKGK